MTVWLVCRYYEGAEGVYSTKQKAVEHVGKFTKDLYIVEWVVDEGEVGDCE